MLRFLTSVAVLALLAAMAPAQMSEQMQIPGFAETFHVVLGQRSYPFSAQLIKSSAPGNVLWPGEQATFTIQLVNNTDEEIAVTGKVDVIRYATKGRPGDIWVPDMFKLADAATVPIAVNIPGKGVQHVTVTPAIPPTFGAYGIVADLGPHGRQFVTSCIRTFAANPARLQFPSMSLDYMDPTLLERMGIQAVRREWGYITTTSPDYARRMDDLGKELDEFARHKITVLLVLGAGGPQPLGKPRPHLTTDGIMQATKSDMAWLPQYDADFQQSVADICTRFGWPKGPITALSLWNEPWEGISISGWGADMPRYREIYTHMALGVEQARKGGAQVLLTGCDSSTNTLDKLFGDDSDSYLKWLDAVTIHYQGLEAPSTYPAWVNRKHPNGRVQVWDTESWVANTDDRVAAVIAVNRSAGYDRAMGVYHGNISSKQTVDVRLPDGKGQRTEVVHAWSVAAAVAAARHFIGERPFREMLFKKGLPWVMVFDGEPRKGKANPDDGTIVVVGDIGEEFGSNNVLFRTVRGQAEVQAKAALKAQLAALPATASAAEREKLQVALARPHILSGATMTLASNRGAFRLYDFYGNELPAKGGNITIPLDGRGFFLRADGSRGSFAKLVKAVRGARIDGLEPLETVIHDFTAPIAQRPTLRLELTNVLNRSISGTLAVQVGGLQVSVPTTLSFKPYETKIVPAQVTGGEAVTANSYPLSLVFDTGADGKAVHEEDIHVNVISKRAITVDGELEDWKGVLPLSISNNEQVRPTLTEAAWWPFAKYDDTVKKGFATGYLAYDAQYFYFAAKVADNTPDAGTLRFATRNDDEFYYPAVAYELNGNATLLKKDVVRAASTQEKAALQKPTGNDRIAAYWENDSNANAFAVDLELPADRLTQVACYIGPWDMHPNGIDVQVTDLATNKELHRQEMHEFWNGAYLVYQLSGKVRLRFATHGWHYTVKLGGVFFDPAEGTANGTTAKFIKVDYDTTGAWQGVYGKDGYHVIGTAVKYPAYATVTVPEKVEKTELRWPEGVRRYSYRQNPVLPAGNAPNFDNVQIAFNVLPIGEDGRLANPPGTMPRYTGYKCTDYEYALNKVAPQYGGGVEIWRLWVPGMTRKMFYPRQPASPLDGPVADGKLVTLHDGNTRIVEAAIPWSELPEVKKALDTGKTIKFSFRVNDNAGGGCMELAKDRSVSKINSWAFHVDWTEHWANEVEFAFEQ